MPADTHTHAGHMQSSPCILHTCTGEMSGEPRAAATASAVPDALRQPSVNQDTSVTRPSVNQDTSVTRPSVDQDTSVTGNGFLLSSPVVSESLRQRAGSQDTSVTGQHGRRARGAAPASPGTSPFNASLLRGPTVTSVTRLSEESAVLPTAFKTASPPAFAADSPGARQLIAEVDACVRASVCRYMQAYTPRYMRTLDTH